MTRLQETHTIPTRLLAAGHRLFWRNGYHATGIQEIADSAGVPKGSFYNHFGSKEAFAATIIENYGKWVSNNWDGLLAQAEAGSQADHVERIRTIFHFFIDHHERAECLGCIVGNMAAEMAESSPVCTSVMLRALEQWSRRLTESITQGQQNGQIRRDIAAERLSAIFLEAWEGALLRMKLHGDVQVAKEMVSTMLDTLFRP